MIEKKHNLQAPGAGLPKFERLFIKHFMVPIGRSFIGWRVSMFLLDHEIQSIRKLIVNLTPEQLQQRVLIKHIFGIEDDTRDWSINLVIEHLAIANHRIIEIIKSLSHEKIFKEDVTIQMVKPKARHTTIEELETIVHNFKNFSTTNRSSKLTKAHPWFVEFNNKGWNSFLPIHTWVHKRQIKAILKRLD